MMNAEPKPQGTGTEIPEACSVFEPDGTVDWVKVNEYNARINEEISEGNPQINEANLYRSRTGDLGSIAICALGECHQKVSTLTGVPKGCALLGALATSQQQPAGGISRGNKPQFAAP